jgi:hypothetical protein
MSALTFMPRPGSDELLYSLLARCGLLAGQTAVPALLKGCLGNANGTVAVDLPHGIGRIVNVLPGGTPEEGEGFIDRNTMFPYLLRYADAATAAQVRTAILGEASRRPTRFGVMSCTFPLGGAMMACRECIRDDTAEVGMPWWRRTHQLPGVFFCHLHGEPLSGTPVQKTGGRGRSGLTALSRDLLPRGTRRTWRGADELLLTYATRSAGLLDPGGVGREDPVAFQQRLRAMLSEFRWSRAPSLLHGTALVDSFRRHPRIRPVLDALEVTLDDSRLSTSMNRLLYGKAAAGHPLLVLIILELAGAAPEDLRGPDQRLPPCARLPIGRPRTPVVPGMPCGNPACTQYAVSPRRWIADHMPAGRTAGRCDACGFGYVVDPRTPGAYAITVTCKSWDALLAGLLSAGQPSVRSVARQLGVAPASVQRHARRLGLWRDEWIDRPKLKQRAASRPDVLRERHRTAWLAYRTGPHGSAKEMPKPAFNAYRYLLRHDRSWLVQNRPLERSPVAERINWNARDKEWAARARDIIDMWKATGSGMRVSGASVGKALGAQSVVVGKKEKLPLLWRVIAETRDIEADCSVPLREERTGLCH